jgi:hypothetical protein
VSQQLQTGCAWTTDIFMSHCLRLESLCMVQAAGFGCNNHSTDCQVHAKPMAASSTAHQYCHAHCTLLSLDEAYA